MSKPIFLIIGSDTGVGKTVLTALLTRRLRERGVRVAALKPICSGGRDDARQLHSAGGKTLALDEVNPWHFRAPLAPLIAARRESKSVNLRDVVQHIGQVNRRFETVIVEGAGVAARLVPLLLALDVLAAGRVRVEAVAQVE